MADNTGRGRFVWHELMTPNSAGAQAFYSKALGWKTEAWEQDSSYSMFVAPSGPLGGSVESRDGPPAWIPYMGTTDIDATVEQVTRLGGSIKTEPTAIPNGSKYAVVTDPQGATFGIHWSPTDPQPETAPKYGEFSWHELATADYRAAFDFYSALLGWDNVSEFDMGPMGLYVIFGRNGVQWGGIFNKGEAGVPGAAYWIGYVRVKDVHDAVKKVEAARGSLVMGPMEVPGGDWIAQFMDPHGALFAVHALAVDVKAAEKPAAAPKEKETVKASAGAAKKAAKKAPKKAPKKSAAKKKSAKKTAPKKKATKKTKKKPARKKKRAAAKRPARKAAKASARKAAKKGGKKKLAKTKRQAKKKKPGKKAPKRSARRRGARR